MDRLSSRSVLIGPKVCKNRRIEDKWGTEYHKAVQNIVFGKQCSPYMPTEPPAMLSEEIVESEPLHVCKQCKDCFRFQSSFEDHNTRHSWILGLWCHNCFKTVCIHVTNVDSAGAECPICTKKNSEKRAYLRARGLKGSQRMGAVKVFYNQCQFVEHMKMHRLSRVNMGDLMLIPLPLNMGNTDWSSEFEIVCEALMERAFLLRKHIIDWLKENNLQDNWWKLINGKSNDTIINEIVDGYQGRQLFKACNNMNYNSSEVTHNVSKSSWDIEFVDNSTDKNPNSYCTNIISDQNVLENEDNPCTVDITFVDCGPTSQCFEPEIPVSYTYNKQVTVQEIKNCRLANTIRINNKTNETFKDSHETDTIRENTIKKTAKSNCSEHTTKKSGINKIPDNSVKISIPFAAQKNAIINTNLIQSEQNLQISRANNKILSLQDPKNITSIIGHLSPLNLISNKKVVVIGQNSCNVIAHGENEITTKKDSSNSIADNGGTGSNTLSQKMCDSNVKQQEITEKIIIKDGKKYLIKRTKNITKDSKSSSSLSTVKNVTKQLTSEQNILKSSLTPTNSNEVINIGVQQTTSLRNIFFLTPSPSPSESSKSSNCESHVKKTLIMPKLQKIPSHLISLSTPLTQRYGDISEKISLIKKENGDLYMNKKLINRMPKENYFYVCDGITKYRKEMFDEFHEMDSLELKERLEHLQCVSEEMRQVLNFISEVVFKEKLKKINTFQCMLEECLRKRATNIVDTQNDDTILNEWEPRVKRKCESCNKYMKPKAYIVGFSKLSKNDHKYCSCYKQVCHECLTYQGTVLRFVAHQNFHKKKKPYVCPDCNIKFDSLLSLEIHTWTVCFHTLRKYTFTCKICEIDGFRDLESITRHFAIMHSKTKISCEYCFHVFTLYSEYVQHCIQKHPFKTDQDPIRLVICKLSNVTLRCEDYMSYLEKYPGVKKLVWFKCPFCDLITTDNKHVMTLLKEHVQNDHVESLSKILSTKAFIEIFGAETVFLKAKKRDFVEKFFKAVSEDTFTDGMPCVDSTVMPRIVNTRTISSEIFERGSQNMEHTWSTDTDEIVNESSQTVKIIYDKEKKELLPKIISVRSINDLKPSKLTEEITKFSNENETKIKSNLPPLQAKSDGKMVSYEKKAMKLHESKEETAHTKELDKDNNELIMNTSHIPESEKPLSVDTVNNVLVNSPITSNKRVSNSTSSTDKNSRIKIVDLRTICKPDIEPQVIAEMCGRQTKDDNISYMVSIPKPPPLAKFPQHLFEPIVANESENDPVSSSKKLKSEKSLIQSVADNSKVRIALGSDTQKKGIDYLCHLCNERINTSQIVIQTHFREKHSNEYKVAIITPQLSRMSHDFINGGYKKFINNKKRKSDNALFVSKRKRRWTPRKQVEIKDANPPVGLCVEQETAEDDEGNFICKKCGQRYSDISNLREHIAANHRLKGRYLICLECGENFVVAPSLQMHLKAFHGIEDPTNYMNQNPSYAPSFDSDLQTEERTTVANQCYVCMAVFEDKAAVDKHLRVHGMAFLNRKRIEARNALEKKANMEENKQNIIKDDSKKITKRDKLAETILEKINAAI